MYKHAALFLVLSSLPLAAIGCGGSTNQQSNPQQTDGGEGGVTAEAGTQEGGGKDAGHDSGMAPTCTPTNGTLAPGYPAMHGPMPQVTYQGGGVLLNPEIVTVTFPGDSLAAQLEQFDDNITDTCWWDTIRAGYCESSGASCVGRGMAAPKPHVEMTTAPAASYSDTAQGGTSTMATYIQQQVASGAFPAPNANTIYALWFPASTTITLDGQTSCQTFGGYHNSTTVTPPGGSNTVVSYAVIPRCQNTLDYLTFAASHEFSEASTDPHVGENQIGFYLPSTNLDDVAWNLLGGGEIGDLCVDLTGLNQDRTTAAGPNGTSWTVQRLWSNANAAAGLDPCVPMASNETYFNVAPPAGMGTIQLAVGASATYTATAFSSGPMNGWQLLAEDLAQLQQQQSYLTINLTGPGGTAVSTAKNGDQITVKITLTRQPPQLAGSGYSGMPYLLVSALSQNGPIHYWPGLVIAQ
jgi:hypothetical protein